MKKSILLAILLLISTHANASIQVLRWPSNTPSKVCQPSDTDTNCGGGGGTPGGSNTQFQYKDGSVFGGIPTATYNKITGELFIGSPDEQIRFNEGIGIVIDDSNGVGIEIISEGAGLTLEGSEINAQAVLEMHTHDITMNDTVGNLVPSISWAEAGGGFPASFNGSEWSYGSASIILIPDDNIVRIQDGGGGTMVGQQVIDGTPNGVFETQYLDNAFGKSTQLISGNGWNPVDGVGSNNGSSALFTTVNDGTLHGHVYLSSYSDDNGDYYGVASMDGSAQNLFAGPTMLWTTTPVSPITMGTYTGGGTPSGTTNSLITLNSIEGHQYQITDGWATDSSQGSGYLVFDLGSDGGFGSLAILANSVQVATYISKNSSRVVFQIGSVPGAYAGYMGIDNGIGNTFFIQPPDGGHAESGDGVGNLYPFLSGDTSGIKSLDTGARQIYDTGGNAVLDWNGNVSVTPTIGNSFTVNLEAGDIVFTGISGSRFDVNMDMALQAGNEIYTPTTGGSLKTDDGTGLMVLENDHGGITFQTVGGGSISFNASGAFNQFNSPVRFNDSVNITFAGTNGTKIGTGSTEKLAFYGSTPIVQPNATTDLGTVLSNLGLRASGTAYPITTSGTKNFGDLTASLLMATDASKNVVSLATTTYPSLSELAFVKGVTSAIQTQLNSKGAGTVTSITAGTGLTGGAITTSGTINSNAVEHISYQPGLLTAVNSNIGVYYKASKASTVDNIIGSAVTFSCVSNPTITMYECGTSATCTSSPVTIGTVTVTAVATATVGTVSNSAITAGDYIGFAFTGGTCASIDIAVNSQIHSN